jgi:hypothetical protein
MLERFAGVADTPRTAGIVGPLGVGVTFGKPVTAL